MRRTLHRAGRLSTWWWLLSIAVAAFQLGGMHAHAQDDDASGNLPALSDLLPSSASEQQLFEHYPTVGILIEEALDALPSTLRGTKHWVGRRRLAGLLPVLRLGYETKESNYDRYLLERDPRDKNRLDDFTLDDGLREYDREWITVSWDLAEFLFHEDELEAVQTERDVAQFQMQLKEKVVNTYMQLRAAVLKQERLGGVKTREHVELAVKIETCTALLDAYTDGYFSQHIEDSKRVRQSVNIE